MCFAQAIALPLLLDDSAVCNNDLRQIMQRMHCNGWIDNPGTVVYNACYGLVAIVPETLEVNDPVIMASSSQAARGEELVVSMADAPEI
jgi:hypothetical protein